MPRAAMCAMVGPTFFRSAARGLHVPAKLTPAPAKHEARKRRASERPRVGCCEELARFRRRNKTKNARFAVTMLEERSQMFGSNISSAAGGCGGHCGCQV